LSDHPRSGSPKFEVMADLRSVPVGRYTVYYRVSTRTVDVLRIVHSHRDIQQISFDEDA
jgi:toxin ParE1/3/4